MLRRGFEKVKRPRVFCICTSMSADVIANSFGAEVTDSLIVLFYLSSLVGLLFFHRDGVGSDTYETCFT